MNKKKVLLVSSSFYPAIGGVENSLRSLAESLRDKNIDVFVVANDKAIKNGQKLAKSEKVFGATVFRYKFLPFFLHFFTSFLLLFKLKRRYNFDVVISRSHITTFIALVLGYSNLKYIASGVYRFQNESSSRGLLGKFKFELNKKLEEIVFRNLDCIYVFSDSMVSQVKKVNRNVNIVKVSPGIDIKRFNGIKKNKIRSEIGLEGDDILLLFLGRVESVKQPKKTIECLKYLPSNYKLLFVGEGSELDSCRQLVEELSLSERVTFKGFTDFPELYYSAADFFLMTSSYESFGQVLLEALAAGRPVIAFDTFKAKVNTATNELASIIDVENSFVFASENTSESLASACLSAKKLTETDIRMINHQLQEHWSWFNVFKSVERDYKRS